MQAAGKRYILHNSKSSVFKIWNLADLHLMNPACARERIAKDIKKIESDPYSFWLGGGDYVEYIGYKDKRFDPDAVADYVTVKDLGKLYLTGAKEVRDLFWPIRKKCFGLLLGNHEKKYALATEQEDRHGWLCSELGVQNLQYCALFDVVFTRGKRTSCPVLSCTPGTKSSSVDWTVRVFCHHGAGYAQTPGGKLNRLVQFMQSFDADVYFCGHVHDQVGRREPSIGANSACTRIVEHEKIGVVSGSYLKTYAQNCITYGEQRGYRPTTLGAAVISIKPFERTFEALI